VTKAANVISSGAVKDQKMPQSPSTETEGDPGIFPWGVGYPTPRKISIDLETRSRRTPPP
jgi:hypothetical protein